MKNSKQIINNYIKLFSITFLIFVCAYPSNVFAETKYSASELIGKFCKDTYGEISHPAFFDTKNKKKCQCGELGEKDATFSNNDYLEEAKKKGFKGGGVLVNGIYYPTCSEWSKPAVDGLSIAEYYKKNKYPWADYTALDAKIFTPAKASGSTTDGSGSGSGSNSNSSTEYKPIDVSGMYKNNAVVGEVEDLSTGLTTKDAEEDTKFSSGVSIVDFKSSGTDIDRIFGWVKGIANTILGLSIVLGIGGLIYLFINLGIYSGNPQIRAGIKQKILILSIATATSTCLGTIFNIILTYMYNKN